jgi:hypothetical protein
MRRYLHNLSHYRNLTCDQGELVPISTVEVLPGDTFQHHTSLLIRTNPLLAPVMHPVSVTIHHWFVPFRIIWSDWEDFITGGEDGLDATGFPFISSGASSTVGSLADYLGVSPGTTQNVCALPFRAYNLIYNEWYRDQQLQTAQTIDLTSGADTTTNTSLLNVNWEKDYFTTARPDEQLGAAVSLPLGTEAPVERKGGGGPTTYNDVSTDANGQAYFDIISNQSTDNQLIADLSNATAATIDELREAFALQKFAEWRNLYGGRYAEYIKALGVKCSDARLQRPEYLGGGKSTIQFSEVLATSDTVNNEIGELKGHGIAAVRSNKYRKPFEEHGMVISLLNVKPRTMYADTLHKMYRRTTREDYWHKELESLGQQEVQNHEVYAAHAAPTGTFGYQDRYDEYRRHPSTVHGEFRTTLDHWHMARKFSSDPALNSTFVTSNPTDRIYATTTGTDQLYIMAQHRIAARRLVSKVARRGDLV